MDPVSLIYYALVCGLLGFAAPWLRNPFVRFVVGVAVGLVAAGVLPLLRRIFGLG